jgi:predicted nucleotide-binding protein
LDKRIKDLKNLDINQIETGYEPNLVALENSIDHSLIRIFGVNTPDYLRYRSAKYLTPQSINIAGSPVSAHVRRENAQRYIAKATAILEGAKQALMEDLVEEIDKEAKPSPPRAAPEANSRKVFVVHGHDQWAREAVARFLERLDLLPIILNEQTSQGQTIIEKIETYGGSVGFAVVVLTPDDIGGKSRDLLLPRARQNVILELGYFIGKLGRGRVCALKKAEIEVPSDYDGVVYTPMDDEGAWKARLAGELHAAGIAVDLNKVLPA